MLGTIAGMGWDDDPEASGDRPAPVPSPDDRLWRHPSELGLGATPPTAVASRGVGTAALAGACLAGAVLAFGAMWIARPTRVERVPADGAVLTTGSTAIADRTPASFAPNPAATEDLAHQLAPALARVEAQQGTQWQVSTAVWIDGAGTLVTSLPAVAGASRLRVIGHDGVAHTASLLGTDEATGVAVLDAGRTAGRPIVVAATPATAGLPAAVLGAPGTDAGSDDGDASLAGVIVRSASVRCSIGDVLLHDAIQLDRALPDDAQGGALIDADGELLGLVVGNSSERDLASAVPATSALAAAREVRDHGAVRRAWLGVRAVDLDPDDADALGVPGGARVTEVDATSPAAAAGLAVGDVVTAIGASRVDDASDLVVALRGLDPGDGVDVEIHRSGAAGVRTVHATLGG